MHLEQCDCVRMDGWMDGWMLSLHTHADGWMQFSILCSPSREQLLRSRRAVLLHAAYYDALMCLSLARRAPLERNIGL
jgi:hypothetical protein